MKRIVLSLLALALVLLVIAPMGFGFWAEHRLQALLEAITENGVVDYTVVNTQRGWFTTTSEVVLEVGGDIGRAYRAYQIKAKVNDVQPLKLTLRNTIHHGPFPWFGVDGGLTDLIPSVATVDSEVVAFGSSKPLAKPVPLTIHTRLALLGGGHTNMRVPKFQGLTDNGSGTVTWSGLDADFDFGAGFKSLRTRLRAPLLTLATAGGRVRLSGLALDSDTHKGIEQISLGNVALSLDSFEMTPKDGSPFALAGIVATGNSVARGDVIDTQADLRVKSVTAGGVKVGPGVYRIVLRNLDAKSLAKIDSTLTQLKKQDIPRQQMSMMMGATLLGVMPQLLEKGPILEIPELSLETEYGKLNGSGRLTVDVSDRAALSNPLMLRQALVAEVDVQIPEKFVEAIMARRVKKELAAKGESYSDEQLTALARRQLQQRLQSTPLGRMLERQGGMYRFKASIARGQLTVNGRAVGVAGGTR